ncbi:MAG: hypothetical protein WC547_10730, partial [Candidatus Omnitrophota bacterium]
YFCLILVGFISPYPTFKFFLLTFFFQSKLFLFYFFQPAFDNFVTSPAQRAQVVPFQSRTAIFKCDNVMNRRCRLGPSLLLASVTQRMGVEERLLNLAPLVVITAIRRRLAPVVAIDYVQRRVCGAIRAVRYKGATPRMRAEMKGSRCHYAVTRISF